MKDFPNAPPGRDDILRETSQVFCLTIENVFRTLLGKDVSVRALTEKLITGTEWPGLITEQMLMLAADSRDGFESPLYLLVSGHDAVKIADLILADFHREDEICHDTDIETLKVYADQIFDYLAVELGTHFQTPFAFDTAGALMVEAGAAPAVSWGAADPLRIWAYDVRIGQEPPSRMTFVLGQKDMDRLVTSKIKILEKSVRAQAPVSSFSQDAPRSLERLMDIPVTLTVEIGKKSFSIKDILNLAEGVVLELDRAAGDPADILINNTLVARGEIVIVNDRFGVRLTAVIDPHERLESLGPS